MTHTMARVVASVFAIGVPACNAAAQPVPFPVATSSASASDAGATSDDASSAEGFDSSAPVLAAADAAPNATTTDASVEASVPAPPHDRTILDTRPKRPKLREGGMTISGRIPPEVIQRIVRQNYGRLRLCHQDALRTTPTLEGRILVSFVIGRKGEISSVADDGSDLKNPPMVACVLRAFNALAFPQPETGIVRVHYSIIFALDD